MLAAASGVLGGLLNGAMLTICARQGQTEEFAAFTVMSAALAWIIILLVGGSSLLYSTGTEDERRAIRSQRLMVAVPVMLVAAAGVAAVYTDRGYSLEALCATAVVAIGNNLSELHFGDLGRQMRFLAVAMVVVATRVVALVLVLLGWPLTVALAVGAVLQLLSSALLARRGPAPHQPDWRGLSVRTGLRAFRLNRKLMPYNLAEVVTGRAGVLALSLVAPPSVVGAYGALSTAFQTLVNVLHAGLQVPMAARTRRRHGLAPATGTGRGSELMMVGAALAAACCGVVGAPWVTTSLLELPIPAAASWLQILAIALPFLTVNRAIAMNRLGNGDYPGATRLLTLTAALLGVAILVQIPHLGPLGAAAATAVAEILTLVVVGALAIARRRPRDRRSGESGSTSAPGHTSALTTDRKKTPVPRP